MTRQEFKQKYFTNNFYWIYEDNYKQLQEIGVEMGCLNPIGGKSIIEWHEGFRNLGFRTFEDNITMFQKEAFLLHNEEATDFNKMINDYNLLEVDND